MEHKKQCKECKAIKDISEFYPTQGECKECTIKRVKARTDKLKIGDPNWVTKERKRGRDKYHRLNYRETHKPKKEQQYLSTIKTRKKFPEKQKAYRATKDMKPKIKGNQLHHWSYNVEHRTDVIELSIADHNKLHRYMIYDQERMMYRTLEGVLLDTKERHLEYYESIKNKE